MKLFVGVLVCLVAAVQGRSDDAQASSYAALGENPWIVKNRVAVSTSGLLNSCIGSLISDRWVLTSASCVWNARFVWLRYGAVNVAHPELVTETSTVNIHPGFNVNTGANDIALISINRAVEFTDNIFPVSLPADNAAIPTTARFCGYGIENWGPGETLSCADVEVEELGYGSLFAFTTATKFDFGAPLVRDGVQYGVLSRTIGGGVENALETHQDAVPGDSSADPNTKITIPVDTIFINVISHLGWIRSVTGIYGRSTGN